MAKHKSKDAIDLDIICEGEPHVDLSFWLPWRKEDHSPYILQRRVRLYGSIRSRTALKYKKAVVYVSAHEGVAKAEARLPDIGYLQAQDDNLLLQIFWPADTFSDLLTLVCTQRIVEISASFNPIKHRSSEVLRVSFQTQPRKEHEDEIDYWFVAKPRIKKQTQAPQSERREK